MADGILIDPGTTTPIKTDDCGAAGHVQVVKLAVDTDGDATLIDLDGLLTSIKTAVELIDNAISGSEMQVDVIAALPAGTNAIGKLAANSGVDIGDVDVTSVPADPFGANADAAVAAGAAGSVQAKLRLVTSQLDSIKTAVELLDNAISGAEMQVDVVTSALPSGAATEATLGSIKTAVELLDNAISGSEIQADIVAALPAGTNAIGKLAANSGVDIGDVDVTSQPARAATVDAITAKLATDTIQNGLTALTPKFAVIDAATSGDNTLVASVAGKKIRVVALFLVAAGTVNARFESGAGGTALTGQMNLVANSGFSLPFNPVGWFETAATTLLNLELSAAISVDGCLTYVEV